METRMMLYTKRADFQKIAEEFGIDQVTARYLSGRLSDLPEASLLPDIEKAASLLHRLIREGRHIRIVGDYDIDGVCATYILQKGLLRVQEALQDVPEEGEKGKASCALIDHVIPDRIRDGYGINLQIIEAAVSDGVEAVLTCDNGIAALEELRAAKERGLKVIVTDHHEVRLDPAGEEQLPPADAIVNPKLSKSAYPEKNICGAVVAWVVSAGGGGGGEESFFSSKVTCPFILWMMYQVMSWLDSKELPSITLSGCTMCTGRLE